MELTKDGVTKNIPENLVSIYKNMGWKEYKKEVKPIIEKTSNNEKPKEENFEKGK